MKLSQLNEITFTVASDSSNSDSAQQSGTIPVTRCNCDDEEM